MAITYGIGILIVGAILGAIGIIGVKQKQPRMILGWLAIAGIVIGILGVMGAIPQMDTELPFTAGLGTLAAGGANAPATDGTQGQPLAAAGTPTICAVEDTTVTLSGEDPYTALSIGGSHRYRINGAPALTVADAGTFTASPKDSIEILWFNASRTEYYGKVSSEVVPCAGTKTFSAKLARNGTLTTRVYNQEGNLIDNVGENETLGVGDVIGLKYELEGQYQRDFSHGFTLVFEYNSSSIDSVTLIDASGIEFPRTSTPQSYITAYGTSSATRSYLLPPLISTKILSGTISIDSDDTANPGQARDGDINMTYLPHNYFINDDLGGKFDGPAAEDEDNVATKAGAFEFFQLNTD